MNVFQLIDDDWWSICSPVSKQSQYMSNQVDYCPERMQQYCCLLRNVLSGFKVFIEVSRFNQSFMNFRMCVFLAFLLVWLICQDLKYVLYSLRCDSRFGSYKLHFEQVPSSSFSQKFLRKFFTLGKTLVCGLF